MDRIDNHVEVPRLPFDKLSSRTGEPSAKVRERVEKARPIQRDHFREARLQTNSDMRSNLHQPPQSHHAADAAQRPRLSPHASVKLTRTITYLAASEQIQTTHVAEAIQYRPKRNGVNQQF